MFRSNNTILEKEQKSLKILKYIENEVAEISLLHTLAGDLKVEIRDDGKYYDSRHNNFVLKYDLIDCRKYASGLEIILVNYHASRHVKFIVSAFPSQGLEYVFKEMRKNDILSFAGSTSIQTNDPEVVIAALKICLTPAN